MNREKANEIGCSVHFFTFTFLACAEYPHPTESAEPEQRAKPEIPVDHWAKWAGVYSGVGTLTVTDAGKRDDHRKYIMTISKQ